MKICRRTTWVLVACWLLSPAVWAQAQQGRDLPVLPGLGSFDARSSAEPKLAVSAQYQLAADGAAGELSVTARLSGGWYIYSVTQKRGGPIPTTIQLGSSTDLELSGPFQPDRPPKTKSVQFFKVPVEEHHGQVTWTAPFRLRAGVDPQQLRISGELKGQICNEQGGCIPLSTMDTRFAARFAPSEPALTAAVEPHQSPLKRRIPPVDRVDARDPPAMAAAAYRDAPAEGYRAGTVHASLRGQLQPATAAVGQRVNLELTIRPDSGWHVYANAPRDPKGIAKPTLIAITEPAGWVAGDPQPATPPVVKSTGLSVEPEQQYHESTIRWTVPLEIPPDLSPGPYVVRGMIGYQTCSESRCDMPVGVQFEGAIRVQAGDGAVADAAPLRYAAAKYATVATYLAGDPVPAASAPRSDEPGNASVGFDPSRIVVDEGGEQPIGWILLLAFVGGFVLNFMPCVLPVIGLKIMTFVQQAGENRARVFMLNVWYSLGLLSIFWLLATLASAASLGLSQESLGWGEQFNYDGFTIPLLCVVFAMGLSFLGVWEIPIPGLAGSGRTADLAQQEGVAGAFFKGVLTTILATPCSGPGLATALTWSATKPPQLVYLVFTFMGLGMALPYLVIGAFPRLIRFIPKPGPWMDTFKQLMGFVLMGTVVYMFTLVQPERVIPTLALIFALWAGCWWVGRTEVMAGFATKARAWAGAAAFVALIGWFAYGYQPDKQNELPWQPYTLSTLDQYIKANHTVMVDFTADW